jgi:hypothetical protein
MCLMHGIAKLCGTVNVFYHGVNSGVKKDKQLIRHITKLTSAKRQTYP